MLELKWSRSSLRKEKKTKNKKEKENGGLSSRRLIDREHTLARWVSRGAQRRGTSPEVERDVHRDDNIGDVPWFSTVTKSAVPMQCLHSR